MDYVWLKNRGGILKDRRTVRVRREERLDFFLMRTYMLNGPEMTKTHELLIVYLPGS